MTDELIGRMKECRIVVNGAELRGFASGNHLHIPQRRGITIGDRYLLTIPFESGDIAVELDREREEPNGRRGWTFYEASGDDGREPTVIGYLMTWPGMIADVHLLGQQCALPVNKQLAIGNICATMVAFDMIARGEMPVHMVADFERPPLGLRIQTFNTRHYAQAKIAQRTFESSRQDKFSPSTMQSEVVRAMHDAGFSVELGEVAYQVMWKASGAMGVVRIEMKTEHVPAGDEVTI